jgi:squalene-hopene/tetraprenyl-beta-curcumene cyclase
MKKAVVLFALLTPVALRAADAVEESWSPSAARDYLDQRAAWWIGWKSAARDQETFCISCHTALPYALGRPALRKSLREQGPSENEQKILDNVTKRVRLWKDVLPIYSDEKNGAPKTAEARGTESIVYALVLSRKGVLDADTKTAFDNMWSLQSKNGAWNWLNFHNEPWEADDSQFWGATLAAIAIGNTPENYRSSAPIRDNVANLTGYLRREREGQSLLNRTFLLWASAKLSGVLTPAQQQEIVREIASKQQSDGGWSTASLLPADWKRRDATALETKSDGYATGLIALALQTVGVPGSDPHLKEGLNWLVKNQNRDAGSWTATSPNKQRDPASDAGRFMSDAATAYAVMALSVGK